MLIQLPSGPSYPGFPGGPLLPGYPALPGEPSGPGMLYVPAKSIHKLTLNIGAVGDA